MDIKTGLVLCNAEDTRDRKPALIFGAGNQNRLSEHASYENDYDFQLRLEYICFIPRSTLNKELRLCFLSYFCFPQRKKSDTWSAMFVSGGSAAESFNQIWKLALVFNVNVTYIAHHTNALMCYVWKFGLQTWSGRLFHKNGPAMTKSQESFVLSRWRGMCNRFR